MNEEKSIPCEGDSINQARDAILKSRERSVEVTGIGVIACFIIAFWSLVGDGTVTLSEYFVFVACLLVSAGGLVWRILKLAPTPKAKSGEPR
jgi:hypothetical protein